MTRPEPGNVTKKKRRRKKRSGQNPHQHDSLNTAIGTNKHADAVPGATTPDQISQYLAPTDSSTANGATALGKQDPRNARLGSSRTTEEQAVDWLNANIPPSLATNSGVMRDESYKTRTAAPFRDVPKPCTKPAKQITTEKSAVASSANASSARAIEELKAAELRIADLMKDSEVTSGNLAHQASRLRVVGGTVAQLWRSLNRTRLEKAKDIASTRKVLRDLEASRDRCVQLERSVGDYRKKVKDQDHELEAAKRATLMLERDMAVQKATVKRLIKSQLNILGAALKRKARAERRATKRGLVMAVATVMDNLPLRRYLPALFETEEMG